MVHEKLNFLIIKEQKDEEGRMICLEAKINGITVILCNIYAPNMEDPGFFNKINKLVGGKDDGIQILPGIIIRF